MVITQGDYMKKKIIISLVAILGIVFSFFQIKYLASKTTTSDAVETEHYTIAPAETIFINGLIEPVETAQINIDPSKGSVNKIHVTDGQIVEKGDLLFEYLNSSITEQIAQLDIQLESHYKEIEQVKKKKEDSKKKQAEQQKKMKEQERLVAEQQKQAEEQEGLQQSNKNKLRSRKACSRATKTS